MEAKTCSLFALYMAADIAEVLKLAAHYCGDSLIELIVQVFGPVVLFTLHWISLNMQ